MLGKCKANKGESGLKTLAMNLEIEYRLKGEVVYQEGEKADYFYVVGNGACA